MTRRISGAPAPRNRKQGTQMGGKGQPLARSSPCRPKKKAARVPRRERGPPAHWLPGVEEFTSSFFFRWPPPKLKRLRFGLRSSGFYPQMVCDHLVHQRERYKSVESRINLLLGTPPRYCGADETRDWSRLSNTKTINSRVGDDSIKRDFRERKRGICYPQSCTFLTFPHICRRRICWGNQRQPSSFALRAVSLSSRSRRADMMGSAAV